MDGGHSQTCLGGGQKDLHSGLWWLQLIVAENKNSTGKLLCFFHRSTGRDLDGDNKCDGLR